MNLSELTAEVVAWTNRPDLTANIQSAIRRVTLSLHRGHAFARDLQLYNWNSPSAQLATATLTRFRGLSHVENTLLKRNLEILIADDLYDQLTGKEKLEVCYLAGGTLNFKWHTVPSTAKVYYFQDPDIATATYSSWIADTQPDAIITGATARVLSERGETQIASTVMQSYMEEQRSLLAANNLVEIR